MPQLQENESSIVKVEVFLDSSYCLHPWAHIEAIVSFPNLTLPARQFIFMGWKNNTDIVDPAIQRQPSIAGREIDHVVLYNRAPKGQCTQFLELYKEKFGNISEYNRCCNNCADATSFILDYFFPETAASSIHIGYKAFQLLFGIPFFLTCGLLPRCCPGIPCMNLPADVFRRAELLSCLYGDQLEDTRKSIHTFSDILSSPPQETPTADLKTGDTHQTHASTQPF